MNRLWIRGDFRYGWPQSTVNLGVFLPLLAIGFPVHAASSEADTSNSALILRVGTALGILLLAQVVIPLIKSWYQKRQLRSTYRSYLAAHVDNTLESFGGAGSTHFAKQHLVNNQDSEWVGYLREHNIGVPEILLSIDTVINNTRLSESYIPSVSYFGLGDSLLDHTNPIWELDGPEAPPAIRYFLTQRQLATSLDYQYDGWYFELIKGSKVDRERWCLGLENVQFDMAQHYRAALELSKALE